MAAYEIRAMYEYYGVIEADTPEEAENIFLSDLDTYYWGTYSLDIEETESEDSEYA